jgi:putative membrane protein
MQTLKTWRLPLAVLAVDIAILLWSMTGPSDRFTWLMEVVPFLVLVPILALTGKRFRFTNLAYVLMGIHAAILMVGGRYTYAEVPLGFWVKDAFDLARNHYDRLGHLAQGFIPAIVVREILVRTTIVKTGKLLFGFVLCICVTISTFYEFFEWWTALLSGEGATAFLGTQGDPWDTQWDMFLATCGSVLAQLTLGRLHDRQMARLQKDL